MFKPAQNLQLWFIFNHNKILTLFEAFYFAFLLLCCLGFLCSVLDFPATSYCMEQDCKYVVNNDGNVQVHPKTGEPLQDCKVTKSEYVVAMETVERLATKAFEPATSESSPKDCNTCQ